MAKTIRIHTDLDGQTVEAASYAVVEPDQGTSSASRDTRGRLQ